MHARARKSVWMASLAVAGAFALVLFFCDPERVPVYPVCAFHALTGLQCPGCGCLRAMHQLLHGNVAAALRFNAMFVLSLPILAAAGWRLLRRRRRGEPGWGIHPAWLWLFLAAWVVFGILRNVYAPLLAAFAR